MLRNVGTVITCNHCGESVTLYDDVARCPWCSYYNSVMMAMLPGDRLHPYPPTLMNIDTVTRLPYYEGN
jgi:hypothetical protein